MRSQGFLDKLLILGLDQEIYMSLEHCVVLEGSKEVLWTECLCPPLQIHVLKSNPQCDGIWRWGLWEVIRS